MSDLVKNWLVLNHKMKHPGPRRVIRTGIAKEYRKSLYFYLIEGSWQRIFLMFFLAYFLSNIFFASLYWLIEGSILGPKGYPSFWDSFFFSVQTMTTIGYGHITPASFYGNVIVTIEAAVGLIGVALITGLFFAKVSHPKANFIFSKVAVISKRFGKPYLMLRVGNTKGNDVLDASVTVSILMDETSPEGDHVRRIYDLKLERSRSAFFMMTWVVMHHIDEQSPLFNVNWKDPSAHFISMVVTLIGHDSTYAQTVYGRYTYHPEDVRFGHRFVDVFGKMADGQMVIDYSKFHDTV